MLRAGWVVGPHFGSYLSASEPHRPLFLCLCGPTPSHDSVDHGAPGAEKALPQTVALFSFVFSPDLEARVFATFWLDHPAAEGGAGGAEAPEAEADAEGEKPVAARDPEQAADTFPQTGSVHPLQPR